MNLSNQIRDEAESLCKVIRDFFNSHPLDEEAGINRIIYRLEQLIKEDKDNAKS